MSSFLFSISANKIRRKKKKYDDDDNISFFFYLHCLLVYFLLFYFVTWVFFFNVHLLSSHTLSVDYLYRRLISERLHIHTYMTIEHAIDDGKKIDDQSSRWIFYLGKFFCSFLLVRIRDWIERKLDLQIITVISRLYSSMLRLRLNSFIHPSKFNPYIPVNLSGKETSFYAFPILIFFFFMPFFTEKNNNKRQKNEEKGKKKDYFIIIIEFDLNKRTQSISFESFAGTSLFGFLG